MADTPDLGFFLDRFFGLLGLTLRIHKTIARQCVYDFQRVFQAFKRVLEKWPQLAQKLAQTAKVRPLAFIGVFEYFLSQTQKSQNLTSLNKLKHKMQRPVLDAIFDQK